MVRNLSGALLLTSLLICLTASRGPAQAPAVPSAPVPVVPSSPGGTGTTTVPPRSSTPAPAVLGQPTWSDGPGPVSGPPPVPPPVPSGPFGSGGPACPPFQDRNGPLLHNDPLLVHSCEDAPGWFSEVDIAIIKPHIKNALVAPVSALPGVTDQVHVPQAELDWTGVPRLALGFRMPEGWGEFLVSYRFLVSEGRDVIGDYDPMGDATLKSRLDMNVIDLDYRSHEYSLDPLWDLRWQTGVRIAGVYFDSRADGGFLEQRTSDNFWGAGPRLGLDVGRRLNSVPGLSAYAHVEGSFLLGHLDQNFEENYKFPTGTVVGGASHQQTTQGVPVFSLETGLRLTPPGHDRVRFSLGYQFEKWWYLGQVQDSRGDLADQGFFFRSEFNF